jgi:hypothetical protein
LSSLCRLSRIVRPVGVNDAWAKVLAGTRKELAARLAMKRVREEIRII